MNNAQKILGPLISQHEAEELVLLSSFLIPKWNSYQGPLGRQIQGLLKGYYYNSVSRRRKGYTIGLAKKYI